MSVISPHFACSIRHLESQDIGIRNLLVHSRNSLFHTVSPDHELLAESIIMGKTNKNIIHLSALTRINTNSLTKPINSHLLNDSE